jgi:membrane protease YdiL (CAAX protease family)
VANWRASRNEARGRAVEDVELLISSRIAVGASREFSKLGAAAHGQVAQLADQAKSAAKKPRGKLLVVSVVGELQGSKTALAELDRVAPMIDDAPASTDLATLRTIYSASPAAITQEQRTQLLQHEGWFGSLALSFGLPDSEPFRAKVLHEAKTTFLGAVTFEFSVGLAALIGFALLILAIVLLSTGRVHRCYRPAPLRTTAFLESFALYLGGYLLISVLVRLLMPRSMFVGSVLVLGWVPFAMLWPLLRGVSWSGLKGGLGWYWGQGLFREMGAGITAYVAGLPILIVALVVTMLLTKASGTSTSHPIMLSDTRQFWHVIEIYLLASVFAPLVEESLFRGALFNHLRQWHGWLLSAALSSFIFAALHPQGWAAIPVLGSIGFVFAGIREWRGTFIASATAHALNNAVVTTFLIVALR